MTGVTLPSRPPAGEVTTNGDEARRTAALWVAGTGAFLLVVAAALFVAVRWDHIPDEAKLAAVFAVTGGCLLAGHRMRATLPATGSVLFHLGAFLLPVNLAALNTRIGLEWQELLLAEGMLGAVAFAALGSVAGSVMLHRVAGVSVVVAAAGIGALTPVPASVTLAAAALGWAMLRPGSLTAVAWAATAGFMPLLVLAAEGIIGLPAPLGVLDLAASADPLTAAATGILAAATLAWLAGARRDLAVASAAFAVLGSSLATVWVTADLPRAADLLALPAAFLALGLGALAVRRDPFWGRPAGVVALLGEVTVGAGVVFVGGAAAAFSLMHLGGLVLTAPFANDSFLFGVTPDPVRGAAFGVLALGWLIATLRRLPPEVPAPAEAGPWWLAAHPAALATVAAVLAWTGDPVPTGATMLLVAAAAAATRRPALALVVAAGAIYAPVTASGDGVWSLLFGFSGAAILAAAGMLSVRPGALGLREGGQAGRADGSPAGFLAAGAVLPLSVGAIAGASAAGRVGAALFFVGACWLFAAALQRVEPLLGQILRFASLGAIIPMGGWSAEERLVVLLPLLLLLVLDAVRLDEPPILYAAAAAAGLCVINLGVLAGLSIPLIGVALSVLALVFGGARTLVEGAWRAPFEVGLAFWLPLGLAMAAGDAAAFGAALILAGAMALAAGALTPSEPLSHLGGAAIVVGIWIELATGGVGVSEAYVAPAALHLLAAGVAARRRERVSSWAAYAPAVGILGASALLERAAGGSGWHAVLAGTVGVAAVIAGGRGRLAGPLLVGTAVLVAVAVHESLAVAATIPTWAWLALGGSVLLAAGVALERSEQTPAAVGRRVVDIVATRFE